MPEKTKAPVQVVLAPVQWEHTRRVLGVHYENDQFEEVMTEMSLAGWELVGLSNHTGVATGLTQGLRVGQLDSGGPSLLGSMVINHEQKNYIDNIKAHPAILETVGVFKRPLTKENKQKLKQQAELFARKADEAKEAGKAQEEGGVFKKLRNILGDEKWPGMS